MTPTSPTDPSATTPSESADRAIAAEIAEALVREGLITQRGATDLVEKILSGRMTEEDWLEGT